MIKQPVSDLVWLQTSFLGDIILTTAAIRLGKEAFPKAKHHLVTTAIGEAALKDSDLLDSIVVFDKRGSGLSGMRQVKRQLAQSLKNFSNTVILKPHLSYRSSLLAKYLGPKTISFKEAKMSWLADVQVTKPIPWHEASRDALLLEPLGVPREKMLGIKPVLSAIQDQTDTLWKKELGAFRGPLIGIAPGSVWGTKRWPAESYAELTQKILTSYPNHGIVLLGSKDELVQTNQIMQTVTSDRLWNLAGKTTLRNLRSLFPELKLLVTNDSSPTHYASAFNIPTVAIFGATVPEFGFGPLADQSTIVEIDLDCRPCSMHGPTVCPLGHFKCMREITSDQVFAAIVLSKT